MLSKRFEITEKLYRLTLNTILKMAGGKMDTPYPHPTPLDPLRAVSYRNHQKCLAYFSHLEPLVLFSFTKRQTQKGGLCHNAPLPRNMHLLRTVVKVKKIFRSADRKRKISLKYPLIQSQSPKRFNYTQNFKFEQTMKYQICFWMRMNR